MGIDVSRILASAVALSALAFSSACFSGGRSSDALAPKNDSFAGPKIVWQLDARPLPELPFPNDVGTTPDRSSPTGRRINVSLRATTAHETRLRRLINGLDGFGTYSPITIRFDARLDLAGIFAVQHDDDPRNDAIYLINVDPDSSHFGETIDLDFGSGPPDFGGGYFPLGLDEPDQYFLHDPRAGESNLVFETVDEDLNGNGTLDWGEDTDGDGVLDQPNLWGTVTGSASEMDPYRHHFRGDLGRAIPARRSGEAGSHRRALPSRRGRRGHFVRPRDPW